MLDTKKLLTKILDALKADYVVEQGTSGGWDYRKWKSGTFDAWFNGSITWVSDGQLSSASPTWYRSHYAVTVPSAIGTITLKGAVCSNSSSTNFHVQSRTELSGTTITQYGIRGGGTLTGTYNASVYAWGTWS